MPIYVVYKNHEVMMIGKLIGKHFPPFYAPRA
jgi:hypothetical protein